MELKIDYVLTYIEKLEADSRRLTNDELRQIAEFFEKTDSDNRKFIRDYVQGTKFGANMAMASHRVANEALISRDTGWIKAALMLHIIEGMSWDKRENWRTLDFVFEDIFKLGICVRPIWNDIKHLASENVASYMDRRIDRFESRSAERRRLN